MKQEKLIGEGVENNDSILKEMAYPVSFNMEEFKTLKSFNQRIKYCSARLPRIGAGSSRIVFQIDNEKCLKLAKNQRGIAQNEAEDDGYIQSLDLAAEVYDTHPEYLWIEMQLARKAKPSDFQRLTGFNFKIFCAWVDYIKSKRPDFKIVAHLYPDFQSEDIHIETVRLTNYFKAMTSMRK